jgi:hypothetical protein
MPGKCRFGKKKQSFLLTYCRFGNNYCRDSKEHDMEATLEFTPTAYSERTLRLILSRAQEWQCPPAEAVMRLLDELAAKSQKKDRAAEQPSEAA